MNARISKRTVGKFVFRLILYAKVLTFIMFTLVLCNTLFMCIVPIATERVVDMLLVAGQPIVYEFCIAYIIILLLATLSTNVERYISARQSEAVANHFRVNFFQKVLRQDYNLYNQGAFGDVETAMTSCIEDINDTTYCFFETLVVFPIGIIIGLTYISNISYWLLLLILVQVSINYLIMYYGSHLRKRIQIDNYQKSSKYSSVLSCLYHAYENIRLLSLFNRANRKHEKESNELAQSKTRMAKANYINISLMLDISEMIVNVVIIFAFYQLIQRGTGTIGEYIAFSSVKDTICGCFNGFAKLKVNKATFDAAIERINEVESLEDFLSVDKICTESPEKHGVLADIRDGEEIALNSIEYSYPNSDQKFLFDFKFEKNNCYLLMGANGVGKSTFVRLVSGMLSKHEFEENIGDTLIVLPQNIQLFDENVVDILFNDETVISEDIAQKLGVLELISRLKKCQDHNTWINSLSGGEKKKILLTLILSHAPEVMIFDEPFAEVDNNSQMALAEIICECIKGRIIIVISHETPEILMDNSILLQLQKVNNVSTFQYL